MKIPKHIRQKLSRIAALQTQADTLMLEVEAWLEAHGFAPDELRCGDGSSLEEFEAGFDCTERFCARLEAMQANDCTFSETVHLVP